MTNRKLTHLLLAALALLATAFFVHLDALLGLGCCLAAAPAVITEDQLKEFKSILDEIKGGWAEIKTLPDAFKALRELPEQFKTLKADKDKLETECAEIRKLMAARAAWGGALRVPGLVSDDCARQIAATAICLHLSRGANAVANRSNLEAMAKEVLGVQVKTALTASDIPLPTVYSGEVAELVSQFGTARRYGTVYPLGSGTVKLPRLGTDTTFGLIAMSGAVTEKSPTVTFVTFTPEKFGGLIRLPSEIDQDSIVGMGQFLARYSARQLAAAEDYNYWASTGAGSGVNGTAEGLTKNTITNSKVVQMASGKTKYSDATLANFRAIRAVPDEAAIRMGAYYVHTSFEQLLSGFNTAGDKPYIANGVNGASLDGFPIRWIPSLPAYSTSANASKVFALFGDTSWQYLGVRGGIRFDTSLENAFDTDEIMIRALERFTVGLMALGAVAGLETAAS